LQPPPFKLHPDVSRPATDRPLDEGIMMKLSDDERLDEILAVYIEAVHAGAVGEGGVAGLRARCLAAHPDLRYSLESYFEDEDSLRVEVKEPEEMPPVLDRYRDISLIGQGAMGVVYRAFDEQLRRWVALKIARPGGGGCATESERFRRETHSMAKLRHPHIVRVFDVDEYDGRPYLSMELIDGISLDQCLARFHGDQQSIARLVRDIARAVHHAHQREILHRDLKPSNIMVNRDGDKGDHAFVCDFGLAKRIGAVDDKLGSTGSPASAQLTATGQVMGTAAYMSPEQARGESATTLSDIYGLGAILYTLLTGGPPYRGDSLGDTLAQVGDPSISAKPPRTQNPCIDRTLEAICLKSLRDNPDERYPSAEGLARDLDRWLTGRVTEARLLGMPGRARLWSRRNPLGVGLVCVFLALLALVVFEVRFQLEAPRRAQQALADQRADMLGLRLSQLRQAVATTVADPRFAPLLAREDTAGLQTLVDEAGSKRIDLNGISPFESWFVVDVNNGRILARWPSLSPLSRGVDLRERHYIAGLLEARIGARAMGVRPDNDSPLGGLPVVELSVTEYPPVESRIAGSSAAGTHSSGIPAAAMPSVESTAALSRVFKSLSDGLYKFGVSALVQDARGETQAAVVATVTTSAQMGMPQINTSDLVTAVLARRETASELDTSILPPGSSDYLILLHPGYERRSKPEWFPRDKLPALAAGIDENYHDPIAAPGTTTPDRFAGRWIAMFAPVPNSEFIVVVQQRGRSLLPPVTRLAIPLAFMFLTLLILLRVGSAVSTIRIKKGSHEDAGTA
jgi:hypothetical protein